MNQAENTVVLDNSPISFVLIGPGKFGRAVYARSNDKNLDLVGMDLMRSPWERRPNSALDWRLAAENPDGEDAHVVRSKLRFDLTNKGVDEDRLSEFSFVWRGACHERDIEIIQHTFRLVSLDISISVDSGKDAELGWHIAPVVMLCREAEINAKRKRNARRSVFIMSSILYVGIVVTLLLSTSDIISDFIRSAFFN